MAFTTGKQQITPRRGTDSYIILCEQAGWDYPDADGNWPSYDGRESYIDTESGTHLRPYPFQPQASDLSIVREGTTINASYFKGSPIHSKDGEGPASVSGDLIFNVSGNGTGQILRAVVQDLAPTATQVGTYTETEILGSTSATGSTTTTSFTDDLSEVPVPVQVTVTLDSAARVNANETGTITIIGENRLGDTNEDADLSWTPDELTGGSPTLSKTTTMYFQEITSIAPNGEFSAGNFEVNYQKPPTTEIVSSTANLSATTDATLEAGASNVGNTTPQPMFVTLSGAAINTGVLFAYIHFEGTDANDNLIDDSIRYLNNTTDLGRTKQTTTYFKTVRRIHTQGFSGGTYKVEAVNQATDVTFTPSTSLPVFWTMEVGKGKRADTYRNVIPNTTSINFSRTEPVRVTCSCIGGVAELGQNLSHAGGPYATQGRNPTNRDKLNFTSDDVFSGWQCSITIGGVELAAQSATLTVNHNIVESDLMGGKYPEAAPTSDDEREMTLTIEMQTDDENDFRDIYDSNMVLRDVQAQLRNISDGAFPHQLQFQWPVMQITADPDFIVRDFGIIGQTLSLRGIYSEGLAYEFRILANYSLWYPVTTYMMTGTD